MLRDMHNWTEIRRLVLTEKKSKRAVCRDFSIHWKTLEKILSHPEPPGYRQPRDRPKFDPFLPIIHEILEQEKTAPRRQRHSTNVELARQCREDLERKLRG